MQIAVATVPVYGNALHRCHQYNISILRGPRRETGGGGRRKRGGERGRGDILDKGYDRNHDDNGVKAVEDVGFTRKDC